MNAQPKVISMDEHRKAGPQLEDGYIRIANELFDAMMLKLTSFRHYKVAMAIARKTYGYGKKTDDITISQLAEITGIHRNNVGTAVRDLEQMRVILPVQAGAHGLILGINKHHGEWVEDAVKRRGPGRKAINLIAEEEGNQIDWPKQSKRCIEAINLIETSNQNVAYKRQPQKTTPKDNSKSIAQSADRAASVKSDAAFSEFWEAFGHKKGKANAKEAFAREFAKALHSADWLQAVMTAAAKEAQRRPFLIADGQTPIYAQGWLTQRRYEDEDLQTWGRFTAEQQAFVDCFNENIGDTCPPCDEWTERRAAMVDIALQGRPGGRRWSLERWAELWRTVRDESRFDWPVSIEWMLDRENLAKVLAGQYRRTHDATATAPRGGQGRNFLAESGILGGEA